MAEKYNISPVVGKDNDSLFQWARDAATKLNEFMRQTSDTGAFFVWDGRKISIPQNTTIAGAEEIVFNSQFVGNCVFILTVVGASGGVNVALNGTNLGTLSDPDTSSEILYEVSASNLVNGLNSFKIWDTAGDSAELRKLEGWRNFSAIKLAGVTPSDDVFLVGDGSAFVGESGATVRNSIGANIDEANTFFGATDLTGAEAENLSDGSDADSLHSHAHNNTTSLQGGIAGERFHLSSSEHTEVTDFFSATDITGAEAENLSDGSNADSLHTHAHNQTTGLQGGTTGEYYHLTSAQHSEVTTFFGSTDISAAEAETLTDGSNADSLHVHDYAKKQAVDTTAVGNVGAGEDDLITYTLPADTLADGESLRVTAFGTTAANGNNKTIKIHLGSTELSNAPANTPNDQDWCFEVTIIRTGASAGKAISKFFSNDSSDNTIDYKAISEDFTTALTIKCTGEATSDDDIVQEALLVEYLP